MNLQLLLNEIGAENTVGTADIVSVTEKAENVKKGSLFVAVRGKDFDGNELIGKALSSGAAAVISDSVSEGDKVIRVGDARRALSFLCSAFYGHPQNKMKMIGITGTNGKTTTAEYLRAIFAHCKRKCSVIGTLGSRCDGYESETGYTTPLPEILFRELDKLSEVGTEYCIAEISSQALSQKRAEPIRFEAGVFTNVGSDHLDYHKSVRKYAEAKAILVGLSDRTVINADDMYSELFEAASKGKTYTYSLKGKYADYMAKNLRFTDDGLSYILLKNDGVYRFQCDGIGELSAYNTLAALSCADVLGISPDEAQNALRELPSVKGRLQRISSENKTVYIDFAHTPEALYEVLRALKSRTRGRLICVFGCGGNRDKEKRPKMGAAASSLADRLIITSDNPRNEAPELIMNDISAGVPKGYSYEMIPDRKTAVEYALSEASSSDTVLIAGKGHEEYQLEGAERKFFSDEKLVKKILGVF